MSSKKNPASSWKLYCIIDKDVIGKRDPVEIARTLFKNGVGAAQLRYKNAPSYELLSLAKKMRCLANKYGRVFLINDRVDVAIAAKASGVHLGSGDTRPETTRSLLGKNGIIGKTVHSAKDAKKARYEEANYASAGPMFFTPLKKGLKGQGAHFIKRMKKLVKLPLFAIGGINRRNVKEALKSGADGVCVTRGIFDAKVLLRKINEVR